MIVIIITGRPTGRARLFSQPGRQGKFKLVPTYESYVVNTRTREKLLFTVSRTSSRVLFFGLGDTFTTNGECPPSNKKQPYYARPVEHCSGTFALKLYEETDPECEELKGQGSTVRSHIMIHKGPGCSLGCMMVAGGKRGHTRFRNALKKFLKDSVEILVAVKPIRSH